MTRADPTARQWWTLAAVATAVVVAGSLAPGAATGGVPAGADKLLHGLGYGAIAFFVAGARRRRSVRALAGVAAAVALLGAGVEVLQPLAGRAASPLDALANLVGAVAGVLAYELSRAR
ncbi:antibiotic resistance protein VanZ [Halobacterium yunchengense]|uniref:antibiotic resistance protein VanZ n=1 Tax=Halobacterium yunchengense TaxID=3108497 RepID=UPI0030095C50